MGRWKLCGAKEQVKDRIMNDEKINQYELHKEVLVTGHEIPVSLTKYLVFLLWRSPGEYF